MATGSGNSRAVKNEQVAIRGINIYSVSERKITKSLAQTSRQPPMPIDIIKKTYKIVGQGDLMAQFTLIPSGTLNIWFPETGLQMEAPCSQLRFENDTLLYTNGMHYSQARAFWSLTLHAVDMNELKRLIMDMCSNVHISHPRTPIPKRKHWLIA
ncbi:hypothetical protein [Aeromonas veronii]|uniref:hypothetical protein n=1 Tax=Aeromonas veronii TaxID=654 RepID=UPI001D0A8B47|nr:hypothetical protein [Aeromonas veronii]UDN24872.1 hypothetical protein LEO77_10315 [Aeromonas veronii]